MRTFLVSTLVAVTLLAGIWYSRPDYLLYVQSSVEQSFSRQMFERKLEISGTQLLKEQRVKELLPVHYSNIWWRLNPNTITRTLLTNPLVQSAAVTPCGFFSLRCFNIEIEERQAGMLAVFPDGIWLLGMDGGYMVAVAKASESERVQKLRKKRKLPLVYGLSSGGASPRMVRSRALYVLRARKDLNAFIDSDIEELFLHGNGELDVRFERYPFEVVFDSSFDSPERLREEAVRLKELLREMQGREMAIAKIDMAYDQSAVVTLTDKATAARDKVNRQRKLVK